MHPRRRALLKQVILSPLLLLTTTSQRHTTASRRSKQELPISLSPSSDGTLRSTPLHSILLFLSQQSPQGSQIIPAPAHPLQLASLSIIMYTVSPSRVIRAPQQL